MSESSHSHEDLEGKTSVPDKSSLPSSEAEVAIDPAAERRLVRKIDFYLLPLLALSYFLMFLDRGNAGNARVAGLTKEINLVGNDFSMSQCLLFLGFVLFDIPTGIAVRKWGFRLIPLALIGFGLLTIGTGLNKSREGFIVIRFLLGCTEAVVLPGNALLVSRWYRRDELTFRMAFWFFTAAYLSGAFGGLLASGFISADPIGRIHTWRHIFIWEGLITVVVGIVLIWFYPTDPSESRFLTEEERKLAISRLAHKSADDALATKEEKLTLGGTLKIIATPQVLASIFLYICNNITVQGLATFLPTVLATNYPGSSPVRIQLLSVPPNVFAWAMGMICAYLAMRTKQHALFASFGGVLATVGYAMWVATDGTYVKTRYAACFLNTGSGFYGPLILAWAMTNARTDQARLITAAAIGGLGAIGSLISPWMYMTQTAKSGYRPGNSVNLSLSIAVVVGCLAMRAFQMAANKRSAEGAFKYTY